VVFLIATSTLRY